MFYRGVEKRTWRNVSHSEQQWRAARSAQQPLLSTAQNQWASPPSNERAPHDPRRATNDSAARSSFFLNARAIDTPITTQPSKLQPGATLEKEALRSRLALGSWVRCPPVALRTEFLELGSQRAPPPHTHTRVATNRGEIVQPKLAQIVGSAHTA